MTRVRARFHCNSITNFPYDKEAKLSAVYGAEGENADFAKATPRGSIEMAISKDVPASDFFEPGTEYYVYFEKIEKEKKDA